MIELLKILLLRQFRSRYFISGIIVYAVATIWVAYLSFLNKLVELSPMTWNALFWIVMLFCLIQSNAESYKSLDKGQYYFFYTLSSPKLILLSQIISNFLLSITISAILVAFYSLIFGFMPENKWMFIAALFLGSISFSIVLGSVSSIASKTESKHLFTAVLGLPVIVPLLMLLIKIAKSSILGFSWNNILDEIIIILAIDTICLSISLILFPFLWRSN